jgi:hypothetical protein
VSEARERAERAERRARGAGRRADETPDAARAESTQTGPRPQRSWRERDARARENETIIIILERVSWPI